MDEFTNTIRQGDCIAGMAALPEGSVDLVFADPPFNIGYEYDVYEDRLERDRYLDWSREWIGGVHRVLEADGTFWLAIGDEYAAELKLLAQELGFHCRSWVVWYYTFGVNCRHKFTRSHAHLFHFVKDPQRFTFHGDDLDNRVPSARELVYNDKRANAKGRLPDDTWLLRPADAVGELHPDDPANWRPDEPLSADDDRTFVLRPQDLDDSFRPEEDTWYFPRVAGTFKERAGFHGCQMPEQLLGRIIRACSSPGELVLDPFSGSATTLAVAKKLGRRFLGFELSPEYVQYGTERLESIRVGDRLDGAAEPLKSAPKTGRRGKPLDRPQKVERRYAEVQRELTERGVTEAFKLTHDGFSEDRVVADPELNAAFVEACKKLGLAGDARTWNTLLFRLRKRGAHAGIPRTRHTAIPWEAQDEYLFASEIALQTMLSETLAGSLDEILCDPVLAAEFDGRAKRFAPGFEPLQYRWAALRLRKAAKLARQRGSVLVEPAASSFGERRPIDAFRAQHVPQSSGLYLLSAATASEKLYVGEALDLRSRLKRQLGRGRRATWSEFADEVFLQVLPTDTSSAGRLAWQSCLVTRHRPRLNYAELQLA